MHYTNQCNGLQRRLNWVTDAIEFYVAQENVIPFRLLYVLSLLWKPDMHVLATDISFSIGYYLIVIFQRYWRKLNLVHGKKCIFRS